MRSGSQILHSVPSELREALAAVSPEALERLCERVGDHVARVPLLPPAACVALLSEIETFVAAAAEPAPPNSMHQAGHVLDGPHFAALFEEILAAWIRPLAQAFLPEFEGGLDSVYGYLVHYERGHDEFLGWHVDDSDVTLNLCLGDDFSGSELYFNGLRCVEHRQGSWSAEEEFDVEHVPGTAILHAGAHRHGVRDLRRGRRRNLILWCKGTSAPPTCPPWCGAHHSPA